MAITFTDHTINGKVLNAFNNNVVRFGTNSTKTVFNAKITLKSKNLFNYKTITEGYYINWDSGGLGVNSAYYASDYMIVNPGTNYYGNYGNHYAWYNSEKVFISGANGEPWPLTSPANAAYLRVSFLSSINRELIQVEAGTVSSNHEKYVYNAFEITPSPDSKFYFNFNTAVKKAINTAMFADICPYTTVGQLWADINAFLSVTVEYKIIFTDATSETISYTYSFIKGVNQITEKTFFANRAAAFPLHKPTGIVSYVTFFKGYPFDISLYGQNIAITIDSILSEAQFLAHDLPALEVDPTSISFTNALGVHRLIVSKGSSFWDKIYDRFHTIKYGNYEVRMRVEEKCGVYFKWHNDYGGWDYWLFEKNYFVDMKDRQKDEIVKDFDNLPNTKSIVSSTGKVVEDSMTLFANGVYDYEIQKVLGIARSPKVYMYIGTKDAANSNDNWIEVQVSVKNAEYKASTFRKTISIEVNVPSTYTLQL